jgi:peptidyl-tRNA hydrolase
MPPGKAAAQAGHAFLESFLAAATQQPELATAYRAEPPGTKVVLQAPALYELEWLHQQALDAGLPCALITDRDHILLPYFDGQPIVTALGIGPARRSQVDRFLSRLAKVR